MPIAPAIAELLAKRAEMAAEALALERRLSELGAIGIVEAEANIRNKLSRGKFTAAFLLQCLKAIGSAQLLLD